MAHCWISLLEHAKEVGKCLVTEALWPPIKRHIDYWWSFGDNIQGLRDETDCLERERLRMVQKIEEARLRAEIVTPEVGNWSNECTQKLEEARRTLQSGDELKPVNIISRYLMGKSAKETAEGISKLRSKGNLITISDPAPPPAMGPIRHEPTMEFASRGRIEEDIMESLKDEHARVIAICGGGGVGKTTLVQRIQDRVRKENLFDEVVHVVVSQQFDVLKIQKEIAGILGLNLIEDTLAARKHKLHIRLLDSKRKLIVFDDVWKRFNLTDFGVPLENDFVRCKIILTSRVEDACTKMNAKIIRMEVLTNEEAWALFKEKAGSYVEGSDLRLIAEDVVKECKCLPLALVIVGEALKDQSTHVWRDSLSQLRRSMPTDFPEVLENVYKPLKLSYDFMENESVKYLFLICCLFPEDYNIPLELLTLYSIGLGMFEGIRNIEEGRSRTHSFVEKLKSRFLLLNGSRQHAVKMHDVVRDVAIFIGSKEQHGFLKCMEVSTMRSSSNDLSNNCNWMSIDISIENAKLPVGRSDFPNLRLLITRGSHFPYGKPSQVFDANVIYFEGMEELNALSFSHINLPSLPPTLALLKKLATLHLEDSTVEDISVVCEFARLEILLIRNCDGIEELPADFGRLNRLRLLELSHCRHLKGVAGGVISSLVRLEELKIIDCFDKWEAKGNQSEERNASLSELEFLPNLTCLEIDLSDCNLLAQEICLSQRLARYQLSSPRNIKSDNVRERGISLFLPGDFAVGNWIHQLVRNTTQSLKLVGDGSNNFNLADTESLRNLVLNDCSTMKKLANAIGCKFHMLEKLKLWNLTEFEEITDGTVPEGSKSFENLEKLDVASIPKLTHLWKSLNQDVSLGKLNVIKICDCPNLRYLFSVATGRSLVQLRRLQIVRCGRIEQAFWNEIESNTDASSIIEFPKLEALILDQLPNLAAFSQGDEIVEFPRLENFKIKDCPKLRLKIGKCPNLRTIQVSTFNDVHHLLTSCCTRKWNTQLEELVISNCDTIEELLWDEIEDEENSRIVFPELRIFGLSDLPCLTTFYRGVERIKFPKLNFMNIGNLPRLNSLLPMDSEPSHDEHSVHFFCNQKVEIRGLEILDIVKLQNPISKIWCCHVPNNFFNNLWRLSISDVNGIRNLMSSSIAKNLVNLYHLYIGRCQEMVEVIDDDKKTFVTSLFPKLERLTITKLHKLSSFCQWKHAFEFPSLSTVEIDDCPAMRTFSLGSLSTPNLFEFKINGKRVEMKGLNGGTHDHFTTKGREGDKDLEYSCENEDTTHY